MAEIESRNERIIHKYLEGATLQKLGSDFNISHERVRQIITDADIQTRKTGPIASKLKKSFGKLTTRERFFNRVLIIPDEAAGEHWIWIDKIEGGYGRFTIKGKCYYAHKAAGYILRGIFPTGFLRKQCKVIGCVHPNHWKEGHSRD